MVQTCPRVTSLGVLMKLKPDNTEIEDRETKDQQIEP